MFEEFYTTKMSPEKKSLQNRFSKIFGKDGKISKIAIVVTTSLLAVGAVSVSIVLAAFDGGDKDKEKEVFDYTNPIVVYRSETNKDDENKRVDVKYTVTTDGEGVKLVKNGDDIVVAEDDGFVRIKKHKVIDFPNAELVDVIIDGVDESESIDVGYEALDEAEMIDDGYPVIVFTNPIDGYVEVKAPFGEVKNPVTGGVTYHNGVDIMANEGDAVYAAISGTVTEAIYSAVNGNYVVIADELQNEVMTAHLSKISVEQGDYVSAGQQIGEVGATGQATGPHLHFEMKRNGEYIDPEGILVPNMLMSRNGDSPEQVIKKYFAHFAEADHEGMKQFCTDKFIEKRFSYNTVGGKFRAELVSITPVMQQDSRAVHFSVSAKNLTEGKTYGVVSEDIYYTLLNVNGKWKIDSWYLKEDFEKLYK